MIGTIEEPAASVSLGLCRRAFGMLFAPRATFEHLRTQPAWLGMLAALVAVSATSALIISGTEVGRQAALDQAVGRLEAFGFVLNDSQYATLERLVPYYGYATAALITSAGPIALAVLSACVFAIFGRAARDAPTFRQVLAMVTHTGVILAVQRVMAVPVTLVTESMSTPTNMAALLPMLEESGFAARFLGSIDLFTVWWTIILALGIGVLYRRPAGRIVVSCCAAYAALAGIVATLIFLRGGS